MAYDLSINGVTYPAVEKVEMTTADGTKVVFSEDGEGKYIPVPETAAVGQTVVVKTVDENGKPTEWEAADFPKGGGVTGEVVRPKDLLPYAPKHYLKEAGVLTTQDGSTLPGSGNWSSVAYGDNTMVMIASGTNVAARKVDGRQWESITLPKSAQWTDIAYGAGCFVAVAVGESEFACSYDGLEWELVDTYRRANWTSIVWSGKEFIVTQDGNAGYGAMVCSGDVYYDWQYISTVPPANKVLCVNGKYYVLGVAVLYVGDDIWSGVWTDNSEDGYVAWLPTDVAYGDGLFVGVDGTSCVYYSTDFIKWSDPIPVVMVDGSMQQLPYVGYCNGQFVLLTYQHYYGVTATAEEIQNLEVYGVLNLGYSSYIQWVKSIGHQIVILREDDNGESSYWYFDGGDSVSTWIDIITPPSGGGGGGSYSDWSEADKDAMAEYVIAKLPVYNGEVEDV